MIKQMSRYWHWCYRPWPLGLLVGLLSGLLLVSGACTWEPGRRDRVSSSA